MGVTTTKTNKPFNPRAQDQSPKGYNRAKLYSGKALDFDGVNDYVESAEQITGLTTALTFLGHVYIDSLSSAKNRIFTQWDGSKGWFLVTNGTDKNAFFRTNTSNGNVDIITNTAPLKVGEWMHIACTYNGAQMAFYIDGQLIDTAAQTGNITTPTSQKFRVGVNEVLGQPFDGKVTGTKVFDVALTQAQILDLYNNPEKVVPTGVDNTALKLWLPMMEGAGTTAYDGSGNGNHGTISGATYVNGIGAPVSQSAVMDWNKGTNLLPYSEQFGQWASNSSSVTANDTTAPDGQTTADKWVINNGIITSDIRQTITSSVGQNYLLYVFAKAGEFSKFQLDTSNAQFSDVNVDFDLSTGSIVSSGGDNVTEGIIDKGNGWYLCYMVGTAISTSGSFIIRNDATQTGDGSKGMYLWGGGYVQASDITSYIPTIGTAQTTPVLLPQGLTTGRDITGVNLFENVRKQGALNLDGNSWAEVHDNGSLDFGTGSFSLEVWSKAKYTSSGSIYNVLLTLGDNVSSGSTSSLYIDSSLNYTFRYDSTLIVASGSSEGDWSHVVGVYDGTNINIYLNGSFVVQTAATASSKTNTYNKRIGTDTGGASRTYKDQIAQPRIYNRALTAEEVQRSYDSGKNIYTNS